MKKRTTFLKMIKQRGIEMGNPTWLKAYFKSSGISLFLISLIWIGLEFALTAWHAPSTRDTVIAFVAAIAIGYFYAQRAIKKEENKKSFVVTSKASGE